MKKRNTYWRYTTGIAAGGKDRKTGKEKNMGEEFKRQEQKASEIGHVEKNLPEVFPRYCLLPGDPDRVDVMSAQWDPGVTSYDLARRERAAVGTYKGSPIGACDTGMGGGSVEIYLTDLVARGADTFIRVGTTGSIQEHVKVGDIVINDACVRMDGTSDLYVLKGYPAAANYLVTAALVEACEKLGFRYHVGVGCTCASFYTGQCRTTIGGYRPSGADRLFDDLRQAKVLNFEMEGATIFTLARIFGKRAGMCASVVAHRLTGEWLEDPEAEARACLVGAEALHILEERERA